jgi:hypothetical protein
VPLSGLVKGYWPHRMTLIAFLPFWFYVIVWGGSIGISSFLNIWQISPVNLLSPRLLFIGNFCITASFLLLDMDLFRYLISAFVQFG